VGGLKSALDRLKSEKKQWQTEAEKFKGIDPDKYKDLVKAQEDAEAAKLNGKGFIAPEDLPEKLMPTYANGGVPAIEIPSEGIDFDAMVQNFERQLLSTALERTHGVKSKAAALLRMNRTTLVEKVKKFEMDSPSPNS
jgi:DNA-binding NtrC family response regulator